MVLILKMSLHLQGSTMASTPGNDNSNGLKYISPKLNNTINY